MPDLRTQLELTLGGAYAIERELGGGGMARVFVATDRALGRRVVIKVLSPELAAELSAKRFAREIRLAASLQQANIVPVLSAGETDGMPHYVMPFVEGLSLREKLERDGRLSLAQTISILRDVARALAYAHERGVVHRDIKPENILLSGDAAVVTDFGIAKAVAAAKVSAESRAPSTESTVTQIGTAVGTPAYMAPEQISADPTVDHRADIYSFGCLAYELLTGAPPFASPIMHVLFAAHLSQVPVPVGEKNAEASPALASLITRCLEKDPARRPQSVREMLPVLEGTTSGAMPLTGLTRRLSARARRATVVATLGLAAAVAVFLMRGARIKGTPRLATIAVVPFFNVGGDSAQEYLADGMADELATALGKVGGIRVASRSLGYRYKGQRVIDAAHIGRALSVNHVLHGAVRRVGNQLRVSAQLTSASDNREVWSESYDRNAGDALAVQDEITRQIATALGDQLGARVAATPAATGRGTLHPDAYDLYLRGRFLLQRRGVGVRQSVEKFEQAIAKDSSFARAHASLALAAELLPYFERTNTDSVAAIAEPAARRALALDSSLAEAHTALAMAHQHRYDWALAEREYQRAISKADEPDAHIQYGRFLFYTGRMRQAQQRFEHARALDPYSAIASGWVGHMLDLRGKSEEAIAELRRALEIDSTAPPTLHMMTEALIFAGRPAEARLYAERLWRALPAWRPAAAGLLAQMGDTARAMAVIRQMEKDSKGAHISMFLGVLYSSVLATTGDTARVLEALERSTRAREPWPTYYSLSERRFDYLRRSPRFFAILRSVGLDSAVFTSPSGGRIP